MEKKCQTTAKVCIVSAMLVAVQATVLYSTGGGVSTVSRTQDSDGNCGFAYDIVDAEGASNSRSESGDASGNVKGSYSLQDTDGRSRQVDYIADNDGFRATVKTNEPGTARSNPADVVVDSPYEMPQAPEPVPEPVVVAEPVPVQPVFAPVSRVHESKFTVVHGPTVAFRPIPATHFAVVQSPVHVTAPARMVVTNYPFAHGFGVVGMRRFGMFPYGHNVVYNTLGHKGYSHVY